MDKVREATSQEAADVEAIVRGFCEKMDIPFPEGGTVIAVDHDGNA